MAIFNLNKSSLVLERRFLNEDEDLLLKPGFCHSNTDPVLYPSRFVCWPAINKRYIPGLGEGPQLGL